jgi:hypothetical protein
MPHAQARRAVAPTRRAGGLGAVPKAAFVLVLLVAGTAAAQSMYKWVDEKGVTHYSQEPPPDASKASKVTPKVTPPSNPNATASEDWKGKDADFRRRQVERSQKEQADEKAAAKRAQQCEQWKGRVSFLQDGRIYRDNPDGSRTFLDESQRASEIAKAQERASEYCR